MVEAVLWLGRTGCQGRDLPERIPGRLAGPGFHAKGGKFGRPLDEYVRRLPRLELVMGDRGSGTWLIGRLVTTA